jgi:hypothetical protein
MLADVSGDEVESYILSKNIVSPNEKAPDSPTNQPCPNEMPAATAMQFQR